MFFVVDETAQGQISTQYLKVVSLSKGDFVSGAEDAPSEIVFQGESHLAPGFRFQRVDIIDGNPAIVTSGADGPGEAGRMKIFTWNGSEFVENVEEVSVGEID